MLPNTLPPPLASNGRGSEKGSFLSAPKECVSVFTSEAKGLAVITGQPKFPRALLLASSLETKFSPLPARPREQGELCPALGNLLCYFPTDGNCWSVRQTSTKFLLCARLHWHQQTVVGDEADLNSALIEGKAGVWAPQESHFELLISSTCALGFNFLPREETNTGVVMTGVCKGLTDKDPMLSSSTQPGSRGPEAGVGLAD